MGWDGMKGMGWRGWAMGFEDILLLPLLSLPMPTSHPPQPVPLPVSEGVLIQFAAPSFAVRD